MTDNERLFELFWLTVNKKGAGVLMTVDQLKQWSLTVWQSAIRMTTKERVSKAGSAGTGDSKRRPATQEKSIAAMSAARKEKARLRKLLDN